MIEEERHEPAGLRAFKQRRIQGWLEDMLVTAKRAELTMAIRHAFKKLPDDKKQAFIDHLNANAKHYIARDATYKNIIRFGEALHAYKVSSYPPYKKIVAERNAGILASLLERQPGTRLDIADLVEGVLIEWRNAFNHPESYPLPEPRLVPEQQSLFPGGEPLPPGDYCVEEVMNETRNILKSLFPNRAFFPGELKPKTTDSGTVKDSSKEATDHGVSARRISDFSMSSRVYSPSRFDVDSFTHALDQAINYRQIRVGALLNAINMERSALQKSNMILGDENLTDAIKNVRVKLAHNKIFKPGESKNIFSTSLKDHHKTLSSIVVEKIKEMGGSIDTARIAGIPNAEHVISEAYSSIDTATNITIGHLFPEKKEPVKLKKTSFDDRRISAALSSQLTEVQPDREGNYALRFEPKEGQKPALLRAMQAFLDTHGIEAEALAEVEKPTIVVRVPKDAIESLKTAIRQAAANPAVSGRQGTPQAL